MSGSKRDFVLGLVADAERNSTPQRRRESDPEPLAGLGVARFPGSLGEVAEQLRAEGLLFYVPAVGAWHSRTWYRAWVMRGGEEAGTAGEE